MKLVFIKHGLSVFLGRLPDTMPPFLTDPKELFQWGTHQFPGYYTSPATEWEALLQGRGYLEHPHLEWLHLRGSDSGSFLQGMITADVLNLKEGHSRPAFALDSQGKILVYLRVFRSTRTEFLLGCPSGTADLLLNHLLRFVIMEDVAVSKSLSMHMVLVFGTLANDIPSALKLGTELAVFQGIWASQQALAFVFPTDSWAEISAQLQIAQIAPFGWVAWNRYHIRALDPWFPLEVAPGTNPVIYQIQHAISARKGCYIGQETVAMTRDRGRPPFQVARLMSDTNLSPATTLTFFHKGKSVGSSHSSVWDSEEGATLCLATLKHHVIEDSPEELLDHEGRSWKIQVVKHRVED